MATNADQNVIKLKHQVLALVAKYAFEDKLEEMRDEIPFQVIPGPKPQFRCCIYREREIIRQRVKLAEGKDLHGSDPRNIIQVIEAACADCPISAYRVTENCQNCVGKACINVCRFGAIEAGHYRSHIDPQKCKECGKCAEACPYNAIAHLKRPCKSNCPVDAISYDENGLSIIDEKKCIRCGKCIHRCPFGAIGSKTHMLQVIQGLKDPDVHIYAMAAPASEAQFGVSITQRSWKNAMKKLGFTDFVEVALGADLTAASEAEEWEEAYAKGEKKVTSCCPAFVNMVNRHFPMLSDRVSTTVSPMCAVSRLIKAKDPNALTVFIGPCIAKKSEVQDQKIEGNADYVLTFSELEAIMEARDVAFEPDPEAYQEGSIYGKRFAQSGGVTAAVLQSLKEQESTADCKVCIANGSEECRKALLLMKVNRLPEDFVEGMACEGGCIAGPSARRNPVSIRKDRETVLALADGRGIHENLANYDTDSFRMHR